jgi:fructose/tagatose bisphosphate aldolase
MFITTKQILSKNKVVPAFNFSTAEVARAVVEVCDQLGQDVILQTSMNEAKFLTLEVAAGITKALGQRSNISVSLHLDHAKNLEIIKAALSAGYTSVLADASEMGFEESVEFVKGVKGIKGVNDIAVEVSLTEFGRAEEFVEKAEPDLLAPFAVRGGRDKTRIEEVKKVSQMVKTPLVLHNSSSKSDEEIKEAVAAGVVKVNWNTCLREAWTEGLRQTLSSRPDEIRPYNVLEKSVEEVKKVVEEKIRLLC